MRALLLCAALLPTAALAQRTVGTVSATSPTYVDGSAAPISLTTAGGLRVNCVNCGSSGGVDQGAPGNAATPWFVKLTDGTTAVIVTVGGALKVDGSGVTQPVSLASVPTHGVTGTFFQATQPVSIASMPSTPVTGTFFQATQPISAASLPTHGVTGTFWQATQPVSLATAPTTPVTGTFWQATQPVSGTVTANAGTGTMAVSLASAPTTPVTGTFWQATQPVSGPVTDAQLRASAVPVSGTFFQATQPVSVASMPSTPVTGTFWQGTQPVSASALPLPAGAAQDATLTGGAVVVRDYAVNQVGAQQQLQVSATGALLVAAPASTVYVNPFWPRCTNLLRSGCRP